MNFDQYFVLHNGIFGNMWTCVNNNVGDMCWNSMWHPMTTNLTSNNVYDLIKNKVAICNDSAINSIDRKLESYDFTKHGI